MSSGVAELDLGLLDTATHTPCRLDVSLAWTVSRVLLLAMGEMVPLNATDSCTGKGGLPTRPTRSHHGHDSKGKVARQLVSLDRAFAAQLESCDLWEWAIAVTLATPIDGGWVRGCVGASVPGWLRCACMQPPPHASTIVEDAGQSTLIIIITITLPRPPHLVSPPPFVLPQSIGPRTHSLIHSLID
eukprot:GHVU01107841.1.p1 GENE.GHVU01107841.1~~GHVU01107841.1.p1  ORF type:complete len:187 (-),score=27.48 GHVU01107841.1:28-588(-)